VNPRQENIKIVQMLCLNDVFEEMLDAELKDEDIHGTLRNDPFDKARSHGRTLGIIREGIIDIILN
jgi:hypothetical protein